MHIIILYIDRFTLSKVKNLRRIIAYAFHSNCRLLLHLVWAIDRTENIYEYIEQNGENGLPDGVVSETEEKSGWNLIEC